jgi:hypothetical protein
VYYHIAPFEREPGRYPQHFPESRTFHAHTPGGAAFYVAPPRFVELTELSAERVGTILFNVQVVPRSPDRIGCKQLTHE